jgi:hypothetical protein
MNIADGAKTIANTKTSPPICAAFIRRVRAMDGFAAGSASGCVASATLCLIIAFSGAGDASGWAALVWAATTIGALGAYILVRGLSAQATSSDDSARASNERRHAEAPEARPWTAAAPELTGWAAGKERGYDLQSRAKRQSSFVQDVSGYHWRTGADQ